MINRYKYIGGFRQMRIAVKWILVVDGEEFSFNSKKLPILSGKAAKASGNKTGLFKETQLRFRSGCFSHPEEDKKFRIDISNQLNKDPC